jgi:uncharacterized repeat protein (TIGR04138 family)
MQPELQRLIENRPYRLEAYEFVMRSLDRTLQALEVPRHVSGAELVDGIRVTASTEFGPLAKHVLNAWGVSSTRDFGVIVFDLVAQGILAKTDEDDLADFDDCFDFGRAFETDYYVDHPAFTD